MIIGKEKLAALEDSDVFVLPSYSENFGMAVVEVNGCGESRCDYKRCWHCARG